jgi:hypothetical protein
MPGLDAPYSLPAVTLRLAPGGRIEAWLNGERVFLNGYLDIGDGALSGSALSGLGSTAGPASHPDLATHDALGLATDSELAGHANAASHTDARTPLAHAHAEADVTSLVTDLAGKAPTHAHPYEASGAVATHAAVTTAVHGIASTGSLVLTGDARLSDARTPLSHAHLDADIPAGIARDSEVSAAVTAHEGAANPHATYATDTDLTTHAATPHGGGGTWTTVIKTADESKNSLAVVADDLLLKFTTLPNTSYTIRLRAFFLTNATADLKYRLVHAGTTTRVRRLVRRTATTDIAQTIVLATAFDVADVILSTTGLNPWLSEEVILQVGASGGVFKLQWAQVTSNAGPTTCLEGSYLEWAVT